MPPPAILVKLEKIEMSDFEKLGVFYLGQKFDINKGESSQGDSELVLYDAKDLVTHAVCIGMTGSGKTGLCLGLLEEAAIDGIPVIAIDPKGDIGNLLLTFPQLRGEDFLPWIDADAARRNAQSSEEYAAAQAKLWHDGLLKSGQDGERISRLKASCDFNIYTPGASSGLPVSILNSLKKPDQSIADDADLLREKILAATTCILTLVGISGDPLRSREHILIATIIADCWKNGQDVNLLDMVQLIQKPPMKRVGALDLESFYPAKERFELSISINNIFAAPGFDVWLSGEPLDIGSFLWNKEGKPKVSIFSISHLGDSERMFFVTLLLNQILEWMRSQSGTTSLRAILYMDEIFGYFPPVANPPAKTPLLTLLKQARAFGLGLVLATQNPVDIDYKGLSNAGTWFIGRLQTERDKMRVIEGLQSASQEAGGKLDGNSLSDVLGRLGSRVFLMNNVHENGPVIFKTRFTMSYLRGPLNRKQNKDLMDPLKAKKKSSVGQSELDKKTLSQPTVAAARPPVVASEIPQFFIPADVASFGNPPDRVYMPFLLASASIRYVDAGAELDHSIEKTYLVPVSDNSIPADWGKAKSIKVDVAKLPTSGDSTYTFKEPASALTKAANYKVWNKEFATWLAASVPCKILSSPATEVTSKPNELERDFRIRLQQRAFEKRDQAVSKLREKYSSRINALQERLRLAEQRVEAKQAEARQHDLNSALAIGSTVLGAFMGRKTVSTSTLNKAASAARTMGRAAKQKADVGRAEDNVSNLSEQLQLLNSEFQTETQAIAAKFDPVNEKLEIVSVAAKKTNIAVKLLGLAWVVS